MFGHNNALMRAASKPPSPPIRGLIPGYGQQIEERRKRSIQQNTPRGNREGITPRTQWTYPKGPTRSTPGSANRRRPRTWN